MLPQPPPMEAPPLLEPKRVKVFGVLHIVFGAMGILGSLMYFVMAVGMVPLMNFVLKSAAKEAGPSDPAAKAVIQSLEAMTTMISESLPSYWLGGLTGLVVAILILTAGIQLVKRRKNAVASSNRYSYCSIVFRIINVGVYFVVVMPAMNRYYGAMDGLSGPGMAGGPGGGGFNMVQFQQMLGVGGAVVGSVLALVYPILALVMLGKPEVKDYLSKHGT